MTVINSNNISNSTESDELFQKEKRGVKSAAAAIGSAALILAVFSRIWSLIVVYLLRRLGIYGQQATDFLNNIGTRQFEQVLFSVLLFTVPFSIAASAVGEHPFGISGFKAPKKGTVTPYLFMGIGFCSFANYAVNIAGTILESFGLHYEVTRDINPSGIVGKILFTLATAIVPAVVEEFGCRGIMLGLLKKYGEGFAVFASAVVFGVLHGNFEQMPFAFLVGIILGIIRVKTGSIYVCMAVHFVNNFVSVVIGYLIDSPRIADNIINIGYTLYMIVGLMLGIIGVIMVAEKNKVNFEKSDTVMRFKDKCRYFFAHPLVIIFTVVEIINSLKFF